jgi:glutamyl-tRNA synthetase
VTDPRGDVGLDSVRPEQVRVRFPPSPTGNLHVGNVRSALFNWAFAHHHGGTFVLRIEDTDVARSTEDSYRGVLDSLRWLGLDWDEGPEVGGPHGPYRQSERSDIYVDVVSRLVGAGRAYFCYCSQQELDERRDRARGEGRTSGYDGHCRELSHEQRAAYVEEGRQPVIRLRMPDRPIEFNDLVRGEITFRAEHVHDFVLVRANGQPLYTLVNPVDDALMRITHVLRGEDLLSSTPRQIALYDALGAIGIGDGSPPRFGHLPTVTGEGNRRLSKRDGVAGLLGYIERGFLPEGLLNYLALLGWSIADDRDVFSMQEMADAFDIRRVNPNPARFDLKKCEAINAAHLRLLSTDDLAERLVPFLQSGQLLGAEVTEDQLATLRAAAPLVQERMVTLAEAVPMLGFLFVTDDRFRVDPDDKAKVLTDDGLRVVQAAYDVLSGLTDWSTETIERALRARLVEQMGLKPRHAFGPVRVAVTGRRISPPLFESVELLGRERTVRRLEHSITTDPR